MSTDLPKLNLTKHHLSIAGILLCFMYGYLAYFSTRAEFNIFISLSALGFIATYLLLRTQDISFKQLTGLSLVFRLVFVAATPQLSQDFFRFFWDGQMLIHGLNPYLQTVNAYFSGTSEVIDQAEILREGMGSLNASNYSNYPPFSQFLYAASAWVAQGSILTFIMALRLILIGFDLVFIHFARKILLHFDKPPKLLFWYILNPLCILEISGNLHLEGVMIALCAAGVYYVIKHKYVLSGILLGFSVGTKLLSVILVPLILMYIWRKFKGYKAFRVIISFGLGFSLVLMLQFLPFLDRAFFDNYSQSLGLWFGKFEFNAGIYYLVRWLGYQVYGYNIIQTYGLIMPMLTILIFSLFIYKTKANLQNVLQNFLWMLSIYFLLSTTVHPWYVLFPLAIGVFTTYRFPVLWSFLVLLSYFAYADNNFGESGILLWIEYGLLLGFICYELLKLRQKRLV